MEHAESEPKPRKKAGKRKRSSSAGFEAPSTHSQRPADLPQNTINPFSHPPEKLAQFSPAGLSEADEDPSAAVKDFPHRGFGHARATDATAVLTESELETDWETEVSETDATDAEDEEAKAKKKARRPPDPQRRHLDVLVRSMEQFLAQGNVEKAAKAFGLALQLRPRHVVADVRRDNLWAIGAEIIMREGEESREEEDSELPLPSESEEGAADGEAGRSTDGVKNENSDGKRPFRLPRRWGAAANMNKLRAYFETLIQQYPFNWRYPKYVSALDFNIALYSCEIYNVHCENLAALAKLDAGLEDEEDDEQGVEPYGEDGGLPFAMDTLVEEDEEGNSFRNEIDAQPAVDRRDGVRKQALAALTSVVARMDGVMREMPYTKDNQLLRLRAAASLYLADLMRPTSSTPAHEERNAAMKSHAEQQKAIHALQMVLQNGGTLDKPSLSLLESGDEVHDAFGAHLYSTLPIREG